MGIKRPTEINWNYVEEVGNPSQDLRFIDPDHNIERQFLLKGDYSIQVAYLYGDGSGFDTPDDWTDTPIAWAMIEGF